MANKGKKASYRCSPPLPFQGNKSIGRKQFLELIHRMKNGNEKTFVDLFGGSFYLSYLLHLTFPEAKIICNDYDNYKERLDKIKDTVKLISLIRPLIKEERYKRITDETKEKINEIIENYDGYVDLITLSSSLLFSSYTLTELEPFLKHEFYNLLINGDYDSDVDDYVEGIEFVRKDWTELFDEYKEQENVVFIADPPYLFTDKGGYSNEAKAKWGIKDNLRVLDVLKTNEFIFYCSSKPGIMEFVEYLKEEFENVFKDFKKLEYNRRPCNKQNRKNGEIILYYFDEKTEEEIEEEKRIREEKIREEKNLKRKEKARLAREAKARLLLEAEKKKEEELFVENQEIELEEEPVVEEKKVTKKSSIKKVK